MFSLCFDVDFRAPMVLQAQLEPQDREALWVFPVREENVGCQVFLGQRLVSQNLSLQHKQVMATLHSCSQNQTLTHCGHEGHSFWAFIVTFGDRLSRS